MKNKWNFQQMKSFDEEMCEENFCVGAKQVTVFENSNELSSFRFKTIPL